MAKRVGSPLGVALVAAVLVGLVAALVLSFVLDDEPEDAVPVITLDPDIPQPTLTAPPNTSVGEVAPDFTYTDLGGDEELDFDEYRQGRPALINFFSWNCAPCVVEMPHLQDAYEEFGDDVAFLGLAYSLSSPERDERLVERTGVTYPTGRDSDGSAITAFEGTVLPISVFVAADGTITNVYSRKMQPDEIRAALEALVT
jgi:thiol-disulfide isomerase/thioredoxin